VAQLPKIAGEDYSWKSAVAVLALLVLVGGLMLRRTIPHNQCKEGNA